MTEPRAETEPIVAAAARVDYRLTYDRTEEPRRCHGSGINGPDIPNAYYGRPGREASVLTLGGGDWEDPGHPAYDESEDVHIARWAQTAIREAIHEALEWFWVDGAIYLDPHGEHEAVIHEMSEQFAQRLMGLRVNRPGKPELGGSS